MIPPLFGDLVVSCPGGCRRCPAGSKEVLGGQGKPIAPEQWPESSGRGLDDYFLLEAFSCQVWSFSVCLGRVLVAAGGVQLRPRRSQEVRGSPELQNGALRALEEAWMTTFCLGRCGLIIIGLGVLLGLLPWASSPGALQACPGDLLASLAASGCLWTAPGCCAPSGQGFGTTASRSTKMTSNIRIYFIS